MSATGEAILVDARGLLCPWPALRLARAARLGRDGSSYRVLADDPAAPTEMGALCRERGWSLETDPAEAGCFTVRTPG